MEIIGWTLYIISIIYSISGLLYSYHHLKVKGRVSYKILTWLFFSIIISITFLFIDNKPVLIWIIPITIILGITPLSIKIGSAMTYITCYIFNFNLGLSSKSNRQELNYEKISADMDSYFEKGDFKSIIQLCESIVPFQQEDYKLHSTLCRCYRKLIPYNPNFEELSNNQIILFSNYAKKSIQSGEKTLEILLKNIPSEDNNFDLRAYALSDLNGILTINFLLITQIRERKLKIDYIRQININLKEALIKHYQKGFGNFDNEYERFKDNEKLYKVLNDLVME